MLWLILVWVSLSLISTTFLLLSPYLRITSLGWFIGIWWIPIFGALVFLLAVVRRQSRSDTDHFDLLKEVHQYDDGELGGRNSLGIAHGFLPYFKMNHYALLYDGDFISDLYESIKNARHRIWITTYIFSGNVSDTLLELLTEAHDRGVEVKLLVDRVGSGFIFTSKETKDKLAAIPFSFSIFRYSLIKTVLFVEKRLHSKIVIVDSDTAFIGAHNLRDEVMSDSQDYALNTTLKFNGPVVQQLEAVFSDLWLKNTRENLPVTIGDSSEVFCDDRHSGQGVLPARIIFSDPILNTHTYDQYLTSMLMAAKNRVYVWMPYVIPTHTMRNILIAKHKLGVDIKILVPGKSDSILVDNTHQLILKEFNDCNIACAESTGIFDHSKVLIIDGCVILGSTNLDYRSLYRNYEANIEVYNERFTAEVLDGFMEKYNKSKNINRLKVGRIKNMVNQFTSLIAGLY